MAATVHYAETTLGRHAALGGGQWKLTRLTQFTVLFGKNGSGKSLLLRQWHQQSSQTNHYVVPERSGGLEFHPNLLTSQLDPQGRLNHAAQNVSTNYREQVIARIQAYYMARGAVRSEQMPGCIEEIEQAIAVLFPDFNFTLRAGTPPFELTRAPAATAVTDITQLSSGEAQVLTIGLDVAIMGAIWELENRAKRLLLIDEPDAHIHPDLQARFADFVVHIADRYSLQVVVATHSTTLLSAFGQFAGDRCGVVYLDRSKSDFVSRPFTSELKEISACLGGHALMGPLFGQPILLVEGDDDYRVWSQVPRHNVTSFSVIPANGEEIKKYQASLERILSSLRDTRHGPAGFALLDGDKGLPQPSAQVSQDHIRYIKLACHETENLYLTDEVLAVIGTTWSTAAQAIVAAREKFGNKAEKLGQAEKWERQREDIKDVINEVAQIIDRKNVHWTQRIGATIGRKKPDGQLAAFLGRDVLTALWPDSANN